MATKAKQQANEQLSGDIQQCIANCMECYTVCLQTISYCLQQGGSLADAAHLKLMMDCVEICQTSANFMIRGSEQHKLTCSVCAEICQICADACARMGENDKQLALCAETCTRCAESCRQMAA